MNIEHFFYLSDEIMSICDQAGLIKKINPAFENFLGISSKQVEGCSFNSLIHPDDLSNTIEKFSKVIDPISVINLENRIRCEKEEYKWLQWYKLILMDKYTYAIGRNINKQKNQNKLLQYFKNNSSDNSGLLDSILNTIPEFICLLNDKLEFLYLNKTAAFRMEGLQENFIGKTIDHFNLNIPNLDLYKNEIREVMKSNTSVNNTISFIANDILKEIEYFIIPVLESNVVFGAIYIARDVTATNKAKKDFEASQKKLKRIIDLVPYPIFLKDNKYQYTLCNQAQAELFNTTFENILRKTDKDFITEQEELEIILLSDQRILEEQISVILPEQILTNSFNEKKILHTTKIPFLNDSDNSINILGISIDITSIKKSEEELLRINFELDSFVYKSSHDLRAPLRSLIGLLNLARKEPDPAMLNEILDRSNKSIAKLDNFISDLTNFSRNSRLDIITEKINFDQIIKDCIESLKFMENAGSINITVSLSVETDFYSDSNRLSILFMNLISNAIKYHNTEQENQYVMITVCNSTKGCEITVQDNGIGIATEFHSKVFDMFFRASEKSFGSGLGLYIVKQVTDKLGGKVYLESEYGFGTKFIVILPSQKVPVSLFS